MTTDLILGDTGIEVVAQDLSLRRDDVDDSSIGVNFANKTGFWHVSGPRTYEPGSPLAVFWNNLKDWVGPMLSVATDGRVKIGANVTVDPQGRVGIGTGNPETSLHVHNQEVHATGAVGGYSFADRGLGGAASDSVPGQRWVWYASKKIARLWSGGVDQVTVSSSGALRAGGGVVVSNGTIYLPGLDSAPQPGGSQPANSGGASAKIIAEVGALFEPVGLPSPDGPVTVPVDVHRMIDQTDLCTTINLLKLKVGSLETEVAALKQSQSANA